MIEIKMSFHSIDEAIAVMGHVSAALGSKNVKLKTATVPIVPVAESIKTRSERSEF